ncbi:MAG: hypothetical protein MI747_10400 [Desulfobacterales bacterium]|nr:hypothetical protein [Desulfobacterales bacterium]
MTEHVFDREKVKEAVADMKAAMDEMELEELTRAISEERRKTGWGTHPLDLRVSIPLGFTRIYFVLVGGDDQRSMARILEDRKTHPLLKLGNLIFVALTLGLFWLAGIGAMQILSG